MSKLKKTIAELANLDLDKPLSDDDWPRLSSTIVLMANKPEFAEMMKDADALIDELDERFKRGE